MVCARWSKQIQSSKRSFSASTEKRRPPWKSHHLESPPTHPSPPRAQTFMSAACASRSLCFRRLDSPFEVVAVDLSSKVSHAGCAVLWEDSLPSHTVQIPISCWVALCSDFCRQCIRAFLRHATKGSRYTVSAEHGKEGALLKEACCLLVRSD